jgi:LacI family transcriptional regulator
VTVFHSSVAKSRTWAARQARLGDWLQGLPKPVGIMTANDSLGRDVLEACRARELRVPDEVAVIGVDNDELLCRLSSPPLTSVEHGAVRLGHAAAAMLDMLMQGRAPGDRRVLVNPDGVVQRQSTEVLALEDPDTSKAMRFIREHARDPIGVPDVVRAAAVSRSTLEGRFRMSLHCTIRDAIRRAHLERARWLIANTTLPLKQVVAESGFKTVQHMTVSFARAYGQTPARYRRSNS